MTEPTRVNCESAVDAIVSCPDCLEAQTLLGLALYMAKGRLIYATNEEYDNAFNKIEAYLKRTGFIENVESN